MLQLSGNTGVFERDMTMIMTRIHNTAEEARCSLAGRDVDLDTVRMLLEKIVESGNNAREIMLSEASQVSGLRMGLAQRRFQRCAPKANLQSDCRSRTAEYAVPLP
jgi:hypothetical protein